MNPAAQELGRLSRKKLRDQLGEDGFSKHMSKIAKKPRKRGMNVSEETREIIIRQHRSKIAQKARATLETKYGADYFQKLGQKGGRPPGNVVRVKRKTPRAPSHPALSGKQGADRARMMVRIRDNFTCQDCSKRRTPDEVKGTSLRLLDVHHLNGMCGKKKYDSVNDLSGMVTLCHKCHFNHPEHSRKMAQRSQ